MSGKGPANVEAKDGAPAVTVIGIGASAGGLEAINSVVVGLHKDISAAVLVALHLSPREKSQLVEILQHVSELPVEVATQGAALQHGHIYVTPPNVNLLVADGHIDLQPAAKGPYPKPSVDVLFRSLARECGEHAIGVILSGTGTDGAAGIREIKQAGGITIVQEPDEAKYNGMPVAAINTDCVDLVTESSRLAEVISSVLTSPFQEVSDDVATDNDILKLILARLKHMSGVDFSYIKPSTLLRRIGRRSAMHADDGLQDYLDRLRSDDAETAQLATSILISVTSFFRDRAHFDALSVQLKKLVETKNTGEDFRVWVPACATGEEAFSIAMLFFELVRDRCDEPLLTVFASDIDKAAIDKARLGYYSRDSTTNLPPGYVERYFTRNGDSLRLNDNIRRSVVFSVQNLISDPPFSNIDLISCRNFLIYLRPHNQQAVMELFHYSLRPKGVLFLGATETTAQGKELFAELDRKHRIYQCRDVSHPYDKALHRRMDKPFRLPTAPQGRPARDEPRKLLQSSAEALITATLAPRWIIVDELDVIKFISKGAREFIQTPSGLAVLKLHDVLAPELNIDLRGILFRAKRSGESVTGPRTFFTLNEKRKSIAPIAIPMKPEYAGNWLIIFDISEVRGSEHKPASDGEPAVIDPKYVHELEHRHELLKQDLRSLSEELETSNEELQSQSEELQSSNEEMQFMIEQLLTSNEELQSSNEELMTVNEELRIRSEEMTEDTQRWEALSGALEESIISFDSNLYIKNRNGDLVDLFLEPGHVPDAIIWALPWKDCARQLLDLAKKAVESGKIHNSVIAVPDHGDVNVKAVPAIHKDQIQGLVVLLK